MEEAQTELLETLDKEGPILENEVSVLGLLWVKKRRVLDAEIYQKAQERCWEENDKQQLGLNIKPHRQPHVEDVESDKMVTQRRKQQRQKQWLQNDPSSSSRYPVSKVLRKPDKRRLDWPPTLAT
ncbi:hypothetical protein A6R68_09386 [Neotoma lepida]|uniref:Uncharacterized protein n=1 Tax=Neotoma lepida TaxID=56216 RepID=A0A1A6FZY1_NEOLE|nr:hypothetical protein A6R68_09386 [Neotoma lepida]